MNKVLKVSLIATLFLLIASTTISAQIKPDKKKPTTTTEQPAPSDDNDTQRPSSTSVKKSSSKKTDQYFDERGGFLRKMQYAVHLNPSLASLFGGQFNIRVDPSVGYKFNNWAMAGITTSLDYTNIKYIDRGPSGNVTYRYNALSFAYGAYARARLFNSFYVHTDYKRARYVTYDETKPIVDNKFPTRAANLPELNVGAAYRTGAGTFATEIKVTYNVLYKLETYELYKPSPLDLTIGLTYNF
jgi:hypothetical protein